MNDSFQTLGNESQVSSLIFLSVSSQSPGRCFVYLQISAYLAACVTTFVPLVNLKLVLSIALSCISWELVSNQYQRRYCSVALMKSSSSLEKSALSSSGSLLLIISSQTSFAVSTMVSSHSSKYWSGSFPNVHIVALNLSSQLISSLIDPPLKHVTLLAFFDSPLILIVQLLSSSSGPSETK